MPLVSLEDLSIGFRGPLLLDSVSAQIEPGQRIGLLGRNGAGKTTLLRMLDGKVQPDHGSIAFSAGATVARLTQEVPRDLTGTIMSVVHAGQSQSDDPEVAWQIDHAVESTLSRMQLDPDAAFETLSSGMKRRVLLARTIATEPDVLLLDEPTNHLDIPSILWLEDFLRRWRKTLIFVTHDRSFLQNLATRIWEIDRGRLFDWSCDYQTFLTRKEAALAAEEKQTALFKKKLAEEEVWIRQGIKARRTRNEGRVRALKAMRVERSQLRQAEGNAKMKLQEADRTGALVADVKEISFGYDDQPIINDFTTMLGFVILIGTVVNNAILIVHQALNLIRNDGYQPNDAILESVRTRVRPILMTTATTVLGLCPLVLFPGSGSELYRGLGSVLLGGLLVSAIFTLVFVPTLFRMFMDLRQRISGEQVAPVRIAQDSSTSQRA